MDTRTLGTYFSIWNDSWKLLRRYIEKPPVSEQDWNNVLSDMSDFSKTHGENEPAIKMATLMFSLLDAEYKKRIASHGEVPGLSET